MLKSSVLAALLLLPACVYAAGGFQVDTADVVAFVGGESVAQEAESGHLESLLAVEFAGRGVGFRNLAREGDTVFEQPRDLDFPPLVEQLKRVKATVVFAEFGRAEALSGDTDVDAFVAAYEKLCDRLAEQTRRVVLVTPAPFEKPAGTAMPNVAARNELLARYAQATVALAKRRGLPCADVFGDLSKSSHPRLTGPDGIRLTDDGRALVARATMRQLKMPAESMVPDPKLEAVRRAVVEKNRLWFDYARPMNWAFLGGDRQFVPSSRDPDDLKVRIFPRELERFVPLIERAEARVDELAKRAAARGEK